MKQLIKLAWRNIWRKRKRSVIVLVSIAFAIIITISLRSLMLGNGDKMVEAGVKNVGYIQVHTADYWKDKSINDLLLDDDKLIDKINSIEGVTQIIPRLQNFSLAAGDKTSKASLVLGIDGDNENEFNKVKDRIVKGSFFTSKSKKVVIAEGLAKYLKLTVGDTLVLIGQGYQANVAAGKYPISGIVKIPNPQMNVMLVYMPLSLAQEYNSAFGMCSALMLNIKDKSQTNRISKELKSKLGSNYEIMTWDEMIPEILNALKIDTTVFTLLSSCLFLIVGFGIIGTIIMMALERKKEFGMLQAIGLQKSQIQTVIFLESLMLGITGIIIGLSIAIPFMIFMYYHPIPLTGDGAKSFEAMGAEPIMQFGIKPKLWALMSFIVFCIMLIASLLPIQIINKQKVAEAI
ncbi:ABC transporter permease [bacterium]|jgi:ABC-type lipoprotein release transport system permease subunit|nr:ABC transporter permease [bacterium]